MVAEVVRRWVAPGNTHRVFDLVAAGYDVVTGQGMWRASGASLVRDAPRAAEGVRILDLGAGPGNSARAMLAARPEARVVALDRAPAMARRAARFAPRVAVVLGDATALPFADGGFTLVTGHSFLYLLSSPGAALSEARRVLRPGGRVAFLEPAEGRIDRQAWTRLALGGPRFLFSMVGWRLFSGLHRRYSVRTLRGLLAEAGFAEATAEMTLHGAGVMGRAVRR